MGQRKEIDIKTLFGETAKLGDLSLYIQKALHIAEEGNEIILTGAAPIWLYLAIAHALHGKVTRLSYSSPVTGEVVIFNHNPF